MMMNAISIALSGLNAATKRLTASAANIANIQTVGSLEDGKQAPYSALTTTQKSQSIGGEAAGVHADIVTKKVPYSPAFSPGSPFADENGVIGVPNVDLAEEAVNLNLAEIAYKANLKSIKAAEKLTEELLNILDEEV